MFGFSIQNLIFTIAIIVIVWYGFKLLGRVEKQRNARLKRAKHEAKQAPKAAPIDEPDTEDMIACPTCGIFVSARGARSCGRDDCPYPG